MKIVFPEKSIKAIYKKGNNLKEILTPSSFLHHFHQKNLIVCSISNCNKRCDICTNFVVFENTFKCTAADKFYKFEGILS